MAKILVVEDSHLWKHLALKALGDEHDLTIVGTRTEAEAALECEHFDLVVLDLSLPDSDRKKTFAALAGTYYLHGLPIQSIKGVPVLIVSGAEQDQEYPPLVLYENKKNLADFDTYRAKVNTLLAQGKAYQALPADEPDG